MKTLLSFLMLAGSVSVNADLPQFHCYTMGNYPAMAFQRPVKCGDGKETMEVVCSYSAGCKPRPTVATAEPPPKTDAELNAMFQSLELKTSFLVCKAQSSDVKDGNIVSAKCPPPTDCLKDGLFASVMVSYPPPPTKVGAPVLEGKPDATR